MAIKRFADLKGLSKTELTSKARELEESLFRARMDRETRQLKDTAMIWRMRKDLARLKSLLTGKSIKA